VDRPFPGTDRAGAQIRLSGLNVLPPNFELSFDNFRTVRKCRLIWRRHDLIGIAFEKLITSD
jgi:hypothetical protein